MTMISTTRGGIPCFQFPHFFGLPGLRHGIFTRKGGVSHGPFESLNIGLGIGDTPEHVKQNRRLIAQCMSADSLIFSKQVHGASVLKIGNDHTPATSLVGDAMITASPGKFLAIQVADCQPVLLFDPVRRVIAAVHSGWRGSVQNVIGCTISAMVDVFGCHPQNILAGIGPSLGPCCGEFVHYRKELPDHFWMFKDDADRFDFWAISREQLKAHGVPDKNIHTSRLCTKCRTDLFFSYRGEKTTGRFTAVVGMEGKKT